MDEMSSDDNNNFLSSDEECEHNFFSKKKKNFMLCSFAHPACSPLLKVSYTKKRCEVALTCHFSLDMIFLCQD